MKFTSNIIKNMKKMGIQYKPECIKMQQAYKNGPFYPNLNCKCKYYCNEASLLLNKQRNKSFIGNLDDFLIKIKLFQFFESIKQ